MPEVAAGLEVRSRLPIAQIEHQVRKLVHAFAPGFQVANGSTMELLRDHGIAQDRLLTFLSVLFGLLGTISTRRYLRPDFLFGDAAHARNRHSDEHQRATARSVTVVPARGHAAGRLRCSDRTFRLRLLYRNR